jgi:hypothetical protein
MLNLVSVIGVISFSCFYQQRYIAIRRINVVGITMGYLKFK